MSSKIGGVWQLVASSEPGLSMYDVMVRDEKQKLTVDQNLVKPSKT